MVKQLRSLFIIYPLRCLRCSNSVEFQGGHSFKGMMMVHNWKTISIVATKKKTRDFVKEAILENHV